MAKTNTNQAGFNGLIFKELLKRGYSLEGNIRAWNISDSKLWYLTEEQAKKYLELEEKPIFKEKLVDKEVNILKKFMPEIANTVMNGSNINLIDIGCGSGEKAVVPLEALSKKAKVRYCPIDINGYFVSKAIERISWINKGEVVESKWNVADFDNLENISALLRDKEFRQSLFLLLGNTIANYDIHEVLYTTANAMQPGDYILIGMFLGTYNPDRFIQPYKTKEVDDFIRIVLEQIGFEKDELEYGVRFRNNRVEVYYTTKKDKKIKCYKGKEISFKKGDQILVGVSYRYNKDEIESIMKMYFKDVKLYIDDTGTRIIVLCGK